MKPADLVMIRKRLQLSQAELADELNVERQTVWRWENGVIEIPRMAELAIATIHVAGGKMGTTIDLKWWKRFTDGHKKTLGWCLEKRIRGHELKIEKVFDGSGKVLGCYVVIDGVTIMPYPRTLMARQALSVLPFGLVLKQAKAKLNMKAI